MLDGTLNHFVWPGTAREEGVVKVLITGGTGLLGAALRRHASGAGHSVRLLTRSAARPDAADDAVAGDLATGAGLADAVKGMDVVLHAASDPAQPQIVDVEGTRRLTTAARGAGVKHIVYVSIVGVDVIPYRYYACKREAETIVQACGVPYSIVRATQFHPFVSRLLGTLGRMPLVLPVPAGFWGQPVDVGEIAARLVRCVTDEPSNNIQTFGGPEVLPLGDIARAWLAAQHRRSPIVPVPVPGALAAAFRAGRNTSPTGERGRVTWTEWLQTEGDRHHG